jgi:hypothetical protein
MAAKITIKQILTSNQNWWTFYNLHKTKLRDSIVFCIVKLLSCKHKIRGHQLYSCSNSQCRHTKYIPFTCKSRACSSCGKKATERWIQQQNHLLPNTAWQHITFTLPSELWDFFWFNRSLLNSIGKIAADSIKTLAHQKKVTPGIFIALHTFGRDLKRNVHVHLSTTLGGLSEDLLQWKKLYFPQATLMKIWRYQIITLFRQAYQRQQLIIPPTIQQQFLQASTFNQFLDHLYQKNWIVHCAKPSDNHQQTVSYLSRYLKRPAIAESKLRHYDGQSITFKYLDHRTKTYRKFNLPVDQFIARFIQHIPDTGFRMIRYYGFLAHRVRGKLLPIVYELLKQSNIQTSAPATYAELIQKNFNFNPLTCILCGQPLFLTSIQFGMTSLTQLLQFHRPLALLKKI